jgi:rhodanese-related sulfurtransferase
MHRTLSRLLVVPVFLAAAAAQAPSPPVPAISQAELRKLFDSKQVVIVDARGESAYKDCHVRGALVMPPAGETAAVEKIVATLKQANKPIVTYCACPREEEAIVVAEALAERKVRDVRVLTGGWNTWFNGGNPVSCRER